MTYAVFTRELITACNEGDTDSQSLVERLAPAVAKTQKEKCCDHPPVPLDNKPANFKAVSSKSEVSCSQETFLDSLIEHELGCIPCVDPSTNNTAACPDGSDQALANILLDI